MRFGRIPEHHFPMTNQKTINVRYFALLREQRGVSDETVKTNAQTADELYAELQALFHFSLKPEILRVAVNDAFQSWDTILKDKDTVVFIPPVCGG